MSGPGFDGWYIPRLRSSGILQTMGNQGAVAKTPKDQHAYTFGEELANSITHGLGTGLAIAALVILVAFAVLAHDGYRLASAIVYGITLVLQYAASTPYPSQKSSTSSRSSTTAASTC